MRLLDITSSLFRKVRSFICVLFNFLARFIKSKVLSVVSIRVNQLFLTHVRHVTVDNRPVRRKKYSLTHQRDQGRTHVDGKIAARALKAESLQYHAAAINCAACRRIYGRDVRSKGIEREEHVALSQRLMIAQLREDGYTYTRAT